MLSCQNLQIQQTQKYFKQGLRSLCWSEFSEMFLYVWVKQHVKCIFTYIVGDFLRKNESDVKQANHRLHFDVVSVAPTELLCFVSSSVIKMLLTDKMQALIYILL